MPLKILETATEDEKFVLKDLNNRWAKFFLNELRPRGLLERTDIPRALYHSMILAESFGIMRRAETRIILDYFKKHDN